jgi:hypothetical protein
MKNIGTLLALGLGLALITGCNREDATKPEETGTGSAKLLLPELPPNYLAKVAPGAKSAEFRLFIYVNGKTFLEKRWNLSAPHDEAVVITGIPSGSNRIFFGQLVLNDSVTHEGVDSVYIAGSQTTDVYLYLRDIRDGSARVCVVVEGMPEPVFCRHDSDTVSVSYPDLNGCWKAVLETQGTIPPVLSAQLRILQSDSSLQGELIWPNGQHDTSLGFVSTSGQVNFMLDGQLATWGFYGSVDSSHTALDGYYKSLHDPYSGRLHAYRAYACYDSIPIDTIPIDTLIEPPVDTVICPDGTVIYEFPGKYVSCPMIDTASFNGCWLAYIITGTGDTVNADLTLSQNGQSLTAFIHYWSGASDSSLGTVTGDHIMTGIRNVRQEFLIDAFSDAGHNYLKGKFSDVRNKVSGYFIAQRGLCRNIPPPPPIDTVVVIPTDSSCWMASQTLDGKNSTGTFSLIKHGDYARGYFVWTGKPSVSLTGDYTAMPGDLQGVMELTGRSLFYKAKVDLKGNILSGSIYGAPLDSLEVPKQRGTWKASPTSCKVAMFETLYYPTAQ